MGKIDAGTPQHFLLIRRPLSHPGKPTGDSTHAATSTQSTDADIPDGTSFVYCFVPKNSPIKSTLPNLVLMAGRRWRVEETIATGKGPLGWNHHQYWTWTSVQHHTALCGLAMLKAMVLRARLENTVAFAYATTQPPAEDITTPRRTFPRRFPAGHPIPTTR